MPGLRLCREAIGRIPDSDEWFAAEDATLEPASGEKSEPASDIAASADDSLMLSVVEKHHSRIVEEMVKVAFEHCDLNNDGKLSFAQFAYWVERNGDLMEYMGTNDPSTPTAAPGSQKSLRKSRSGSFGVKNHLLLRRSKSSNKRLGAIHRAVAKT